ncbi:MAG: tRNA 2-thiouridine(34) synthase MnmA, partial [Planctomycetales bacterium]
MRHGEQSPQTACAVSADSGLPVLSPQGHKQGCCSSEDADDARRTADKLGIPFYAVDFQEEFSRIMDYFVKEYTRARTPNPCVVCNNWLKFGKLWDYAQGVGADSIATGHYARLQETADGSLGMFRGRDAGKDQSYALAGIKRALLPRLRFPVGDYEKPEIRRIAAEMGMRAADKKDSMEICFVPDGDYAAFVRRRGGDQDRSGEIVTTDGEIVGRHEGIEHFTIGQRRGLGIAFGQPRYVVRIEADTRRVIVGPREDLARSEWTASEVNWLIVPPEQPIECEAQVRYLSASVAATAHPLPGDRMRVETHEPMHGVAPGQAVVCYREGQVLGGGWID